ncbi:hypothetical protein RclHR1_05510001 [Rhizophagus clarus]|uniref:MIR domain-containing protein n=1 Tax=Rhizophagus clarus TaxID=94130 RepID=A0A2Z6S4M7_9GLOM|nr:hypothetical protein RclHR1_05510001 [Rhizophagus clarus]GES94986.1 hypothetical protein GLOIN_2v1544017 [Rhizophagus clarus]
MNYFPKYDGNIHPDEWINDIKKYYNMWEDNYGGFLSTAKSLINPTIKLPTEINDLEKLHDMLKKDVTFTVFKNSNKRKLQSLKYISERDGGDTLKFLSEFRNLCFNSEINYIKEQKKYFFKALSDKNFFLTEFCKIMNNVNSMNELIKEFEKIVMYESNIIRSNSTVALKHVATGKYLTSIEGYCYVTGSKEQLIFAGDSELNPNAVWYIDIANRSTSKGSTKGKYIFTKSNVTLRHKISGKSLGICYYDRDLYPRYPRYQYEYYKSPSNNHTEVSCGGNECNWSFKHSKLEIHEKYLKSNDIINLSIKRLYDINGSTQDGQVEFLRSHDIQFTIGNDTLQEVVCHNERLGGIDEWCIELIKQA